MASIFDETVTVTEDTQKYVALPPGTMGYLEEKIRVAMLMPRVSKRKLRNDGMEGVTLLKQIAMSAQILADEQDHDYEWLYKAEVTFDMRPWMQREAAPIPFLTPGSEDFKEPYDDPQNPNRRRSLNPFPLNRYIQKVQKGINTFENGVESLVAEVVPLPGSVRRPDVIIVEDPKNLWPGRGTVDHDGHAHKANLDRLVEVKFQDDTWGEGQEDAYVAIAGDSRHMTLLNVQGGEDWEKMLEGLAAAGALNAFLKWLRDYLRLRARIRPKNGSAQPVYFEPWLALKRKGKELEREIPALWNTAEQGVRYLSHETRQMLSSSASWLFHKGQWVKNEIEHGLTYLDEEGHLIVQYSLAKLREAWKEIQRTTNLTLEELKKVNWGHVAMVTGAAVATAVVIFVLTVSGVDIVAGIAAGLVWAFTALIDFMASAAGPTVAALITALSAPVLVPARI